MLETGFLIFLIKLILNSDIDEEPLYDLNVNKQQDDPEDIYGELMNVRRRIPPKVIIVPHYHKCVTKKCNKKLINTLPSRNTLFIHSHL